MSELNGGCEQILMFPSHPPIFTKFKVIYILSPARWHA